MLKQTKLLPRKVTSSADDILNFFKLDFVFVIKSSSINFISFLTSSYFNLVTSFFIILILFKAFLTIFSCSNSSISKKLAYNPSSMSLLLYAISSQIAAICDSKDPYVFKLPSKKVKKFFIKSGIFFFTGPLCFKIPSNVSKVKFSPSNFKYFFSSDINIFNA